MASSADRAKMASDLLRVAAELARVGEQLRSVAGQVQRSLGASATGADRRMLVGIDQATGASREARQALAAAASSLRALPAKG